MACKSLCYPCPYDHRFVPKMIGVHCNKILPQGQLFTHNGYNLTYIALIQKRAVQKTALFVYYSSLSFMVWYTFWTSSSSSIFSRSFSTSACSSGLSSLVTCGIRSKPEDKISIWRLSNSF